MPGAGSRPRRRTSRRCRLRRRRHSRMAPRRRRSAAFPVLDMERDDPLAETVDAPSPGPPADPDPEDVDLEDDGRIEPVRAGAGRPGRHRGVASRRRGCDSRATARAAPRPRSAFIRSAKASTSPTDGNGPPGDDDPLRAELGQGGRGPSNASRSSASVQVCELATCKSAASSAWRAATGSPPGTSTVSTPRKPTSAIEARAWPGPGPARRLPAGRVAERIELDGEGLRHSVSSASG